LLHLKLINCLESWLKMLGTTIALTSTIALAVYLYRKRARKQNEPIKLHRPNWKKDVVYLVQFPVSPHVRSISPFSLKLETWIKLNEINYENVYSIKFSKKGQIPYIELNGEQIADSNIIIPKLKEHFNVNPDAKLSSEENAIAHAVATMLENHTAAAGFHWRYGYNNGEFCDKLMENYASQSVSMFFFRHIQPYGIRLKGMLHGIGRHTPDEQAELTSRDLRSVNDILGGKNFLLSQDSPTSIDCTVFGHLAQFLYIPMAFPQKKYMLENCPNLIEYVDRMKYLMWPNWEDMCKKECMKGKMGYEWKQ